MKSGPITMFLVKDLVRMQLLLKIVPSLLTASIRPPSLGSMRLLQSGVSWVPGPQGNAAQGKYGALFFATRGKNSGSLVNSFNMSLLQNSLGSGIYCREELLSLGARASRRHKTWQGRGDWLHRVGRFTRRLTLEQRLDKYAGGTPALPGGNPWLARCRSLSRALFCRSILPPSHARLRILQKAHGSKASLCLPLWYMLV